MNFRSEYFVSLEILKSHENYDYLPKVMRQKNDDEQKLLYFCCNKTKLIKSYQILK